ncbi:MAG TPA: hypothetical protein VMU73_07325, partial [Gaiellaceae bacterium]|nr:hypothetical protein [Gaiellaceae bacterium]
MRDNLAALQVLQDLRRTNAAPSAEDRKALSAWHGWGAAPQLFDRPEFEGERTRLRNLLGEIGYAAAARTTLNAHYTDDRLVDALWAGLHAFGIEEGVVLEPGCGRGSFLAVAPDSFAGVGIELDPATADIARLLVDDRHRVLARDFAKVRLHAGSVDAVIGNVPFGRYQLYDPEFNPGVRLSIHDHFIVKSLAALAPSGVAVLLTSRYSLDRLDAIARRQMGELADFLGAVRLPEHSHEAAAGTTVVTDVVVFRRRADGTPAHHAAGFLERPEQRSLEHGGLSVSRYFSEHPERVLGEVTITSGPFGPELAVRSNAPVGTGLADALAALAAEREVPPYVGRSLDVEAVVRSEDVEVAPVGRIERTVFGFRQYGPGGWEHHDVGA